MALKVKCGCGQVYELGDEWAGQQATCQICNMIFQVPTLATPTPSPQPSIPTNRASVPSFPNQQSDPSQVNHPNVEVHQQQMGRQPSQQIYPPPNVKPGAGGSSKRTLAIIGGSIGGLVLLIFLLVMLPKSHENDDNAEIAESESADSELSAYEKHKLRVKERRAEFEKKKKANKEKFRENLLERYTEEEIAQHEAWREENKRRANEYKKQRQKKIQAANLLKYNPEAAKNQNSRIVESDSTLTKGENLPDKKKSLDPTPEVREARRKILEHNQREAKRVRTPLSYRLSTSVISGFIGIAFLTVGIMEFKTKKAEEVGRARLTNKLLGLSNHYEGRAAEWMGVSKIVAGVMSIVFAIYFFFYGAG